tara:strand:- start:1806 stop:2810 length:1005 start_codon:yes stop_codon:yes gene_type:complete
MSLNHTDIDRIVKVLSSSSEKHPYFCRMKLLFPLLSLILFTSSMSNAQGNVTGCECDTSFNSFTEGTTLNDSINWSKVSCYYARIRGRKSLKSVVNYRNGKRHGMYATYFPKEYWVQVRQRGYQQATPRRYHRRKDFYRREGKSLFGKSESGIYVNGNKDGTWYTMDTNQRILSTIIWKNGTKNEVGRECGGLYDLPNTLYRSEFDSIKKLVSLLENGTHDYFVNQRKIISFEVNAHQLNGTLKIYKKAKGEYVYSIHEYSDNCLSGSSVTFSITGDTTRIESNYRRGIPYTVVSYTPSSRGTTYYRDPRNSYELNSEYRNGLIVERREKVNLK